MDACFRLRNQPSCRLSEGRPAAIVYDIRKSMSRVDNFRTTAIYTGRLLTIPYILGIPFNACYCSCLQKKNHFLCDCSALSPLHHIKEIANKRVKRVEIIAFSTR